MCDSTVEIELSNGDSDTLRCTSQYDEDDERHPENHTARVWW